jgi:hypothetical protein
MLGSTVNNFYNNNNNNARERDKETSRENELGQGGRRLDESREGSHSRGWGEVGMKVL